MQLTHAQKLKKAKGMMNHKESKMGVSPFNSESWNQKKASARVRLLKTKKK